jgi:uncharacterized membrane protein YbhN (UPF0104 family)
MSRRLRVLGLVVLGVALAAAARRLDWRVIGETLAGARLGPVLVAVALNLATRTVVRARRTQLLLEGRVGFGALIRMHLAGYAAGTLLPGPAEEIVCCTQLATQHGLPARELVRLQLVDKALGVLSVALVALALLPLAAAVILAALATIALAIAVPRIAALVGWLVVSNALCIAMIGLCLVAAGAQLPLSGWIEIFLATSVTGAITLLPGQLGTLESAFALTAAQYGAPPALAIAAALLYRLAFAPTALAGVPMLWRSAASRPRRAQAGLAHTMSASCQLPDAVERLPDAGLTRCFR